MSRRISWPFQRSSRSRRSSNLSDETIDENLPLDDGSNTLEDLGLLLLEQGKCLDELTSRSNSLAAENVILRERISSGIDNVVPKSGRRGGGLINGRKKSTSDDAIKKVKDENDMLLQQADLLVKELNDANASIAERDQSIASLSHELSGVLEKARVLMVEKKTWKVDMLDKTAEIESLQTREKQSASLKSELKARVEQLQSEVEELRGEAEMLVSSTSRSASEIAELRTTLQLKENEVERLDEQRRGMERELSSTKRDARASIEATQRLKELNRQQESQRDDLQQKVNGLSEELCKSDVKQHKLQSKCDNLEKEIDAMSTTHRESVSTMTSSLSKIEERHAAEIQSKENIIDKLRRQVTQMQIEHSTNQREKQSLEQRCLSLTRSLQSIGKDHQISFQETLHRATTAEKLLEGKVTEVKDLKKLNLQLETKVQTLEVGASDKDTTLKRIQSSMKDELQTKARQNESLSSQICRLKEEAKRAQQGYDKVVLDLQQEAELRLKEVEEKCENLTALSKVHQLNAKRNEDLLEKQSVLYKTLLDEMNAEKKQQRHEMEKVIKDEREVSARLMTKTQELNSTISKLSADHFLLKEAQYMQNGKMQKLEQIVASGEVKLRTMTGNYCQMQNEMEKVLTSHAETKRRLHETKIELMRQS